jgi:two-component system sensor histidine kinase QseC
MRILLAEDDPLLGDGLRAGLRQRGFLVDWVQDGEAAERELRAQPYNAVVLDLGLPRKDGLDVLSAIRQARITTPVLVLTARDTVSERVLGLDRGADDHVVKPVDLDELAARLRALVRRAHGQPQECLSAMTQPPHSLQHRLLAGILGVVVCVWLGTALMIWLDARHELDELLDSHLAQAAAVLVVQQAPEIGDEDHGAGIDAPTLHRYAPKVAFQVFHEGRLALCSANAPATPMVQGGKPFQTGFDTVHIGGAAWRVFAAYGAENDVQVFVGEELASRDHILWAVLRSTLWPMAVALPLLALALWWTVSRGMAPLRQLGAALAQRQPDALSPVVLDGAPSEVATMVDALNALLARIGALLESERRFTADASHELRTPIAAIRAQAQVTLAESDDALRRHALTNTLAGCDRASRLVDQLLTLSRLEAAQAPAMADVDLSALSRQVVADLAAKAVGKGQTLALDAPAPCPVPGNETLLAVLVRNLVDNAVRYSPAHAQIQVRVSQNAGQVVLRVEDSGPGLDAAQQARLGERFFRVPGQVESGSGLGWSIVQRIAAVHRLDVRVQRATALGGLAVEIRSQSAKTLSK